MSFVTIIAKSINFDSIGKMQKCSRFSDCKSEPVWKVSDKLKNCFQFCFVYSLRDLAFAALKFLWISEGTHQVTNAI